MRSRQALAGPSKVLNILILWSLHFIFKATTAMEGCFVLLSPPTDGNMLNSFVEKRAPSKTKIIIRSGSDI